ncbi:hypothetical protein Bbelb_039340 [Branchiostoma belcheri]|nr:hypothetical protein Bbelb_039340 [Branchiostoma belcheri]
MYEQAEPVRTPQAGSGRERNVRPRAPYPDPPDRRGNTSGHVGRGKQACRKYQEEEDTSSNVYEKAETVKLENIPRDAPYGTDTSTDADPSPPVGARVKGRRVCYIAAALAVVATLAIVGITVLIFINETYNQQEFTPTSRPVSGSYVYKYWREISLTAVLINASTYKHDFRVDCELCRHWGLSRRTGAKQNCAGGVEERRGRSRFFAGAKQNGAGAKQNGGGEEEGDTIPTTVDALNQEPGQNQTGASEVVQCPLLSHPLNGFMTGFNSYRDVVNFTCEPGYNLVGTSSLTCLSDGTWNGNLPTCTGFFAGPLPSGSLTRNAVHDATLLFFGCFVLRCHEELFQCVDKPSGRFLGSLESQGCVLAPSMFNTAIDYVMAGVVGRCGCGASYSDVTITDLDYADDVAILAEAMDILQPALQAMDVETQPLGLMCPLLSPPLNGFMSGSNSYGDVVNFTCEPGYNLVGTSSLTCLSDGTWNGNLPTCTAAQCPLLSPPLNGFMTGSNSYGDVVNFTCEPGYNLVGTSSLTCLSDGTWNGNLPSCTAVQCPPLSNPLNGFVSGSNSYGDVVHFTCEKGYRLVGESSLTCLSDGTWNGQPATCTAVPFSAVPNGGHRLALVRSHSCLNTMYATVTTRRTCFCVLSTCKNVGNRTASVRAYERATYGLRESNFTILTCNCCTDSARSMCVPRTVLASSVLTPHFPVDLLNDHAEHTCTIPVYKDDLTGDCQLVSKMPRKAQKKTTRQDPKKRVAEDTRAASDDEVNRRCTHLQRASTACTRQRSNRTEIVRCKHVQLTYHLRNVRCTQPLTARRVVQTTYVHLAQPCE